MTLHATRAALYRFTIRALLGVACALERSETRFVNAHHAMIVAKDRAIRRQLRAIERIMLRQVADADQRAAAAAPAKFGPLAGTSAYAARLVALRNGFVRESAFPNGTDRLQYACALAGLKPNAWEDARLTLTEAEAIVVGIAMVDTVLWPRAQA